MTPLDWGAGGGACGGGSTYSNVYTHCVCQVLCWAPGRMKKRALPSGVTKCYTVKSEMILGLSK